MNRHENENQLNAVIQTDAEENVANQGPNEQSETLEDQTSLLMNAMKSNNSALIEVYSNSNSLNFERIFDDEDSLRNTLLHQAVLMGNKQLVQLFIDKGANIDVPDEEGATPLVTATSCQDIEMVKFLIEKGANIEGTTIEGANIDVSTPMYEAISEGCVELVDLLLNRGANIDGRSHGDTTPLYLSICCDDLEIAKLLLDRGADVNLQNDEGQSPLHQAVLYKKIEFVKLLLDKEADVNLQENNFGNTPLLDAILYNDREVSINLEEYVNDVSLFDANMCEDMELELIKLLVNNGANIHQRNNEGISPLLFAVSKNDAELVEILQDHDANVENQSRRRFR